MSVPYLYGQELIDAILLHDKVTIDKILSDESRVNVNFVDKQDQTPLCYAAREGFYDVVEQLLKMDANVNFSGTRHYKGDEASRTPLQAAIQSRNKDIVELLIKNKAQVNALCAYPYSHLGSAASRGDLSIVQLLVANKANKHFVNKYDYTILDEALERGHIKVIEFLFKEGCRRAKSSLNAPPEYFDAILTLVSKDWLSCKEQSKLVFNKLKFKYACILDYTFMMTAIRTGHWQVAALLRSIGIPLPTEDDFSASGHNKMNNILQLAANSGSPETLHWVCSLPEVNFDLDEFSSTTGGGWRALDWAACVQSTHAINFLLDRGSRIDLMNCISERPLIVAYQHATSSLAAAQLLLNRGSKTHLPSAEWFAKRFEGTPHIRTFNELNREVFSILPALSLTKMIKVITCQIEAMYYQRTKDPLHHKNLGFLRRLIDKALDHASNMIFEKIKTELLQKVRKRNLVIYSDDSHAFEYHVKDDMKKAAEILRDSLTNRLKLVLCRPPMFALQPFLSYQLAQIDHQLKTGKPISMPKALSWYHNGIHVRPKDFTNYLSQFLAEDHASLQFCAYDHTLTQSSAAVKGLAINKVDEDESTCWFEMPKHKPSENKVQQELSRITKESELSSFEYLLLQFMPTIPLQNLSHQLSAELEDEKPEKSAQASETDAFVNGERGSSSSTSDIKAKEEEIRLALDIKSSRETLETFSQNLFLNMKALFEARSKIANGIIAKYVNALNKNRETQGIKQAKDPSPVPAVIISRHKKPRVKVVSEMDQRQKSLLRFFDLLSQNKSLDDSELLACRSEISKGYGDKVMSAATQLFISELPLAALNPKPLLLTLLRVQNTAEDDKAVPKPKVEITIR